MVTTHDEESRRILADVRQEFKEGLKSFERAFWLFLYWIGYATGFFRIDDE